MAIAMDYAPNARIQAGRDIARILGSMIKGMEKYLFLTQWRAEWFFQAFERYTSEGYSFRTIADNLNKLEIQFPNNQSVPARQKSLPGRSKPHSSNRDVVRGLLGRMAYAGKITYQGMDKDGKHLKRKKPSEFFDATHQAIINMEMFEKAKEIRETRYKNCFSRHDPPIRVYMLTGILRCRKKTFR